MKAELEMGEVSVSSRGLGIVIESETREEATRLVDLWCSKARCCVFERAGVQIRLTVAPTEVNGGK